MQKYRFQLTNAEEVLVSKIDLRLAHRNHDAAHATYTANAEPLLALGANQTRGLSDRSKST